MQDVTPEGVWDDAKFRFRVLATNGTARRGEISTPRGVIRTPAFMPVGTVGTVKALYPEQVRDAGADIILGNTYHLMLRPGAERVAKLGGCTNSWAGIGDPTRRRLPGDEPGKDPQDYRGRRRVSVASRRLAARTVSGTIDRNSVHPRRRYSDAVRRMH